MSKVWRWVGLGGSRFSCGSLGLVDAGLSVMGSGWVEVGSGDVQKSWLPRTTWPDTILPSHAQSKQLQLNVNMSFNSALWDEASLWLEQVQLILNAMVCLLYSFCYSSCYYVLHEPDSEFRWWNNNSSRIRNAQRIASMFFFWQVCESFDVTC